MMFIKKSSMIKIRIEAFWVWRLYRRIYQIYGTALSFSRISHLIISLFRILDQWPNKGTLRPGAKIFFYLHQQKVQNLKWKIGAKARKNLKQNICYLFLLLFFEG